MQDTSPPGLKLPILAICQRWGTLILERPSPAEFCSNPEKPWNKKYLTHPKDLEPLHQVCLIRVGANLCRDTGLFLSLFKDLNPCCHAPLSVTDYEK